MEIREKMREQYTEIIHKDPGYEMLGRCMRFMENTGRSRRDTKRYKRK
jgi:hypothetical protein